MTVGNQRPATTGALTTPQFGPVPDAGHSKKQKAPFPYKALIEAVREHPNVPAAIAVFNKGTKKQTRNQVVYQRDRVSKWLIENYPLECWKLSWRTTPDTWCERKLYVELLGTFATIEDAEMFRKQRYREWQEGRGRGLTMRANRLAREKVIAIEQANRRNAGSRRP
jgi:hypothetical protein